MGKLQYFNSRLGLACSLIALSSFNYGFDNQAFATTQAMNAFDKQFGVFNSKSKTWVLEPTWLSEFNSMNYIGFAIGVLVGSEISSRFGRRWCMFTMSCYALITATIAVTSMSKSQIMSARILNYVYVGMELSVVPAFQSEIVPAPVRGLVVGTYQLSLVLGGFIINSVCRGTSTINNNKSWKIPLGLFYIVPVIIASFIWFIPESPRWLLLKGRRQEAEANLIKLREGAFSQEDIQKEFAELTSTLETEVEQGRFKECFQGLNLKRTIIVVLLNMFQQATGQAFASQYGAIYVKSLGTVNPFNFSLILAAVNIVSISIALLLTDRIGRRWNIPRSVRAYADLFRPLLLTGAIIMAISLMTMGGLGLPHTTTYSYKIGIISMLGLMSFGFSIGYAPLTYVVSSEIPALRLRDKTLRLGFFINVLFNFLVNFSIPYLINDGYAGLHSRVGFIFGSIACVCVVFTYLAVPECRKKSLEQVDCMFRKGIPLRQFHKHEFPVFEHAFEKEDIEKISVGDKQIEYLER